MLKKWQFHLKILQSVKSGLSDETQGGYSASVSHWQKQMSQQTGVSTCAIQGVQQISVDKYKDVAAGNSKASGSL